MTVRRSFHFCATLTALLWLLCMGVFAAPADETANSEASQEVLIRERAAELTQESSGEVQPQQIAARIQSENPNLTLEEDEILDHVSTGIAVGEVRSASAWLAEQSASVAVALLIAVALWAVVRVFTQRHWRRAREIREEIDNRPEAKAAEAALSGEDEEHLADLEREREETLKQIALLEKRAQREEKTARRIHRWTAILIAIGLVTWVVYLTVASDGLHHIVSLMTPAVLSTVMRKIIKIAVIILMVNLFRAFIRLIGNRVINRVSDGNPDTMTEAEMRAQTLINVANGFATLVLWIMAGIMILDEFGIPVGPLIAGAGVLGLAIGFGAQSLVRDFISGFFILMENQYRVGDVVNLAGTGGLVERITMRTTWLRDLSGSVHVIPNGEITRVTNMTYKWSRHVAEIGVSYNDDPDQVIEILERVGRQMRRDEPWRSKMLDDPEVLGLDSFGDSALVFKVLLKTKPLQQWATGREYKRRLFYAFAEAGVEIPFPHRTTYLRMEDEATLNLLTGQPEDEEKTPAGLRPHMKHRHIPPVVPEESGESGHSDGEGGESR